MHGDIVCNVYEEDRAYTSSSKSNDEQAITMEISNCEIGGDWKISNEAWNSAVALAVDICKRYNFKLSYDGTPNGNLTRHNMFKRTTCPGAYLQNRFQEFADTVNKMLDGEKAQVAPGEVKTNTYNIGETVQINGVYRASNATQKLNPARKSGKITKIIQGARNPYLLNDGAIGWVNDSCIVSNNNSSTAQNNANTANMKTISNCKALNLRTSAGYGDRSRNDNIYKAVGAGIRVELIGEERGWAKIKYEGRTLFCGKNYLK